MNLGESLERLEAKGFKESYTQVTRGKIRYFLVDERPPVTKSVPEQTPQPTQ